MSRYTFESDGGGAVVVEDELCKTLERSKSVVEAAPPRCLDGFGLGGGRELECRRVRWCILVGPICHLGPLSVGLAHLMFVGLGLVFLCEADTSVFECNIKELTMS